LSIFLNETLITVSLSHAISHTATLLFRSWAAVSRCHCFQRRTLPLTSMSRRSWADRAGMSDHTPLCSVIVPIKPLRKTFHAIHCRWQFHKLAFLYHWVHWYFKCINL